MTIQQEPKNRNLIVTFRVFQAIFYGILALGISFMFGDLGGYWQIPISAFAVTTTIFGLIGSIITGNLANKCKFGKKKDGKCRKTRSKTRRYSLNYIRIFGKNYRI